ncbi:MAG: hypothetical protein ABI042_01560 [Verrucomicrobiota bacterium]
MVHILLPNVDLLNVSTARAVFLQESLGAPLTVSGKTLVAYAHGCCRLVSQVRQQKVFYE